MNRFISSITGLLILSVAGCTKPLVPRERTAIFSAAKASDLIRAVCYHPPEATGYWTPEEKDLQGVEDTLVAYLKSKRVEAVKDWRDFRRQVVGLKRGDDKLIFIYYFRYDRWIEKDLQTRKTPGYDPESWKKHPYLVFDGGEWFFRVLYDVKTKRFIWYESNGSA